MSKSSAPSEVELKAKVLAVLDDNRIMTVATVRPDGWPQATMVGYAHDDLTLYFVVARTSQKFANIERDHRVSIAIGRDAPQRIHGLSMAARASEVTDLEEIQRLNALLAARYPEQAVFAPREASSAVMRVTPKIISIIDLSKEPGQPELVEVKSETVIKRLRDTP
jgi:general stress protein 26